MKTITLSGDQIKAIKNALTIHIASLEKCLAVSESRIFTNVTIDMLDVARQALEQVESQS